MWHRWIEACWHQVARCATACLHSPALGQSVVAEMQNELVKWVGLFSDLLLFLFLHFGLRFLDEVVKHSSSDMYSQYQYKRTM